jgi:hypothetical protein
MDEPDEARSKPHVVSGEAEEKTFFLERKKQRTFATRPTLPARSATAVQKFLLLFFKKEDLPTPH